jgi:hypothetical protein
MADIAPADIVVLEDADAAAPVADVVTLDEAAPATAALPEHAEKLPGGAVRLPLRYPVTLRTRSGRTGDVTEETIDVLVMHRLTGGALRAIQNAGGGGAAVVAFAQSCRCTEARMALIYDRMDASDIHAASEVIAVFLGNGRPTGR